MGDGGAVVAVQPRRRHSVVLALHCNNRDAVSKEKVNLWRLELLTW